MKETLKTKKTSLNRRRWHREDQTEPHTRQKTPLKRMCAEPRATAEWKENITHVSAGAPTARAPPEVGPLREDLVPGGGVSIQLLLRLNTMEIPFQYLKTHTHTHTHINNAQAHTRVHPKQIAGGQGEGINGWPLYWETDVETSRDLREPINYFHGVIIFIKPRSF